AAREMRDADTWIVPTFNYELRTAKPVMLYWLMRASYDMFGVSEWSARLPSALAACLAVLLTYELARRMFSSATALLSGVVLTSVVQFGLLSHAATPDATLLLFTVLTYLAFWVGHTNDSRGWWIPTAAACGLAMLTKGPVGVALPGLVIFLYFAWNRELARLLDRRILWAGLVFLLVAGPWYGLVANETRGEWLKAFFGNENVNRFMNPMDGHSGDVWFYAIAILVMFAPWSVVIGLAMWYGVQGTHNRASEGKSSTITPEIRAHRCLVCWVLSYFLFFSAAATKLPNYIFPLYPALAILTARFLLQWREGALAVRSWLMPAGAGGLALVGFLFAGGLIYANAHMPGLRIWAVLGAIPVAGALAMGWYLHQGDRAAVVNSMAVASVAFIGTIVALPPIEVDRQKAPRELVRATGMADPDRDVRVAAFAWFEPSLVFYSGREVEILSSVAAVDEFLAVPTPGYLLIPSTTWERIETTVSGPHRILARHKDFLKKCEVLVITNQCSRVAATAAGPAR
ncbi:MAG TPA: glycosyltransferase family 39 protein, partial [Gemmata sp.]|nr:glycosyltransferase family 39 protein [Gemmata sp.]